MTDLAAIAKKLLARGGPYKTEPCHKRIRILLNKEYIVDTIEAKYVWERDDPFYPQYLKYYIPHKFVKTNGWKEDKDSSSNFTILSQDSGPIAVLFNTGPLEGLVRFDFAAMDAWYEEDVEIYVHPRDPHVRVDVLPSTREVRVEIDGVEVGKSSNVMMLFETGLPPRYYLPQTSVKHELLTESKTITSCPYKGDANYYNVTINGTEHKDAIWWYKLPTHECAFVAGRFCFYNEKVDIWIDGIKQERPKNHWS
ncbi:MAG: hypothetical protein Q9187_007497 [Circinaria calcarea]